MTETPIHPGEHIQEEMDALSMSPEMFANQLGIPATKLMAVVEGRESVTAELALRLGHFFGTTARFWMNLQLLFDLEVAERIYGAEIKVLPTLQAA
jgi:addiction module HigA family antidote